MSKRTGVPFLDVTLMLILTCLIGGPGLFAQSQDRDGKLLIPAWSRRRSRGRNW